MGDRVNETQLKCDKTDESDRNKTEDDVTTETDIETKNNGNTPHETTSPNDKNVHLFLIVCILGVSLGIALEIINVMNRGGPTKPKYWVYSMNKDADNPDGLLKHVHLVLNRVGYEKSTNTTDWSLLWAHDYPFTRLHPHLQNLKPHQKVNHYPGTGFITSKVDLATTESKYIPKAFRLPKNKEEFLKYAAENKDSMFLEKNNNHRGVFLKNVSEIDGSGSSFVQEYVQRPLLVDGYKFDIGVYVVLTSVDPLRAYWYKGDVLFRYCPEKYYPFDPSVLDKYVIGDDYRPTWQVPALARPYAELGLSMRDAFDYYMRSQGKDPSKIWDDVQDAIAEILLLKEKHIIEALKKYPSQANFFEMMRFDLVADAAARVWLLEANMSPNLSAAHHPPNRLLYEQLIYGLLGVTGTARAGHVAHDVQRDEAVANMIASQKNIAVWSNECSTVCKESCSAARVCGLCRPCRAAGLGAALLQAYTEFVHRGDFRRLVPPPMKPGPIVEDTLKSLSPMNQLQYLWYQGKCNVDVTWCT